MTCVVCDVVARRAKDFELSSSALSDGLRGGAYAAGVIDGLALLGGEHLKPPLVCDAHAAALSKAAPR